MNNRFIRYSIDHLNSEHITGWCFNRILKSKPVKLSFLVDDVTIGTVIADSYREDLKSYQLHPDGRCGFDFRFPGNFRDHARLNIHAGKARVPFETFEINQIPHVLQGELPRVFFMHIPKTGGTTLNAFATQYYPQDKSAIHIEASHPDNYPQLGHDKSYLAGHLTIQKIKQSFDISLFDLVTILRDPYRQLHSHLAWIRRIGADRSSGFFLKHEDCIQDLAIRLNESDLTSNSNLKAFVEQIEGFALDFFDNIQTRYFLDYRPEKVSAKDLQNATGNIKLFSVIGAAEKLEDFFDRFCARYGMVKVSQPRAFNRLPRYQLFDYDDKAVQSILTPLVETDLQLREMVAQFDSKEAAQNPN